MARLPLIRVAVVGLGTDWEENVAPALTKMASRVRVVAVYDDVAVTAQQTAAKWHAEPILGLRSALARQDIDAFLWRAASWHQDWIHSQLCESPLPVLLGPEVGLGAEQLDTWQRRSDDNGTIVIPEFRLRYTPATLRLRELLATTLGPVIRLTVRVPLWFQTVGAARAVVDLIDWGTTVIGACASVTGAPEIDRNPQAGSRSDRAVIKYPRRPGRNGTGPPELELSWAEVGNDEPAACEVICEAGTLEILTPRTLRWSVHGEAREEALSGDRSSTEVQLDLFARRVVGGLIPTAGLEELRRAQSLAATIDRR